ncbi:MAG: phage portal protein [Desulfobacteraceae bacterium]|nr:phage portal protein [Desulfobacteraceae bacterium]
MHRQFASFFKNNKANKAKRSKRQNCRIMKAGNTNRLTEKWTVFPASADEIIRRNQRILVARAREQALNNDYGKQFVRMCKKNIIGSKGIRLQAKSRKLNGSLDHKVNEAIEQAWEKWSKKGNCDITGVYSWREIQQSCVASAAIDGEFMLRILRDDRICKSGIVLQIIDPVKCPVDYEERNLKNGNFIRHGIEFNSFGRPVAYYFSSNQDETVYCHGVSQDLVKIPANEIIHGFLPEMVGQKRGLSWMGTALFRLKSLNGFEEAALVNARVSAAKMGFFEREEGYGTEQEEDEDLSMEVEPGMYQELPPGVKVHSTNPTYPSGEFAIFTKSMLRGIAAGLGVSYNTLANDLEGVNYSSLRHGAIDERDQWKDIQEWIIESLIEPVFNEWIQIVLLSNQIKVNGKPLKAEKLDEYRMVDWQAKRWQWIDPLKDIKASISAKNSLLSSPGQIIREQGRDPETIWRNYASDLKQMQQAGIPEEFIKLAINKKGVL